MTTRALSSGPGCYWATSRGAACGGTVRPCAVRACAVRSDTIRCRTVLTALTLGTSMALRAGATLAAALTLALTLALARARSTARTLTDGANCDLGGAHVRGDLTHKRGDL